MSVNVVHSPKELVETVFCDLESNFSDLPWLTSHAILALTNSRLRELNTQTIERLNGQFCTYKSADSVQYDSPDAQNAAQLRYSQKLLN